MNTFWRKKSWRWPILIPLQQTTLFNNGWTASKYFQSLNKIESIEASPFDKTSIPYMYQSVRVTTEYESHFLTFSPAYILLRNKMNYVFRLVWSSNVSEARVKIASHGVQHWNARCERIACLPSDFQFHQSEFASGRPLPIRLPSSGVWLPSRKFGACSVSRVDVHTHFHG